MHEPIAGSSRQSSSVDVSIGLSLSVLGMLEVASISSLIVPASNSSTARVSLANMVSVSTFACLGTYFVGNPAAFQIRICWTTNAHLPVDCSKSSCSLATVLHSDDPCRMILLRSERRRPRWLVAVASSAASCAAFCLYMCVVVVVVVVGGGGGGDGGGACHSEGRSVAVGGGCGGCRPVKRELSCWVLALKSALALFSEDFNFQVRCTVVCGGGGGDARVHTVIHGYCSNVRDG